MSSTIQNRAAVTVAAFLFTIAALLLTACGGGGGGGGGASAGSGTPSLNLNAAVENAARSNLSAESEIKTKTGAAANAEPRSGSVTQSHPRGVAADIVNITVNRSSGVNYEISNSANNHGWSVTVSGDVPTIPGWRGFINSRLVTVNNAPGILVIHAESNYENTADTDYLAGGLWVFVPGNAGSISDLQVGAFADGSDPFTQADIAALTGNAVYNGSAIGLYSESVPGASPFDGGEFGGGVALTANFGNADNGSISGRVYNITVISNGTGNSVGRVINGAIVLESANIGGSNSGFFTGNTRVELIPSPTGVFSSAGTDQGGRWGGQFYGNSACLNIPGSVAGTFGGEFEAEVNGFTGVYEYDLIGAFGASAASCR